MTRTNGADMFLTPILASATNSSRTYHHKSNRIFETLMLCCPYKVMILHQHRTFPQLRWTNFNGTVTKSRNYGLPNLIDALEGWIVDIVLSYGRDSEERPKERWRQTRPP